jgi:AcrR family transcriptional regulator
MAAATTLVDRVGIRAVTMEDVAREACVGTGTLYRRFGDRAGLALALLDDHTRVFQDALISGPPPLGPGVPAAERLRAFGEGYLDLLERHADLLAAATAGDRDGVGPHQMYATHLAILLREAAPHLDADFTARALLATLGPAHHVHVRRDLEWPIERLRRGWRGLVDALAAPASG